MTRFDGDLSKLEFLRYDVTSLAGQLRAGGTAAVIGVGGGRDTLNCALNEYHRIVGIEVNRAILDMSTRRFRSFAGLHNIPGLELHNDEGRSYLTRSGENFDLIQASLVDTWAATTAGAMTLSENALYTVDGWRVFFEHLKPGGLITFSRWYQEGVVNETFRLISVAWAMLLSEGIENPGDHLAMVRSGDIATLIASNRPLSQSDLTELRRIAKEKEFKFLWLPGEPTPEQHLQTIARARSVADLVALRGQNVIDYSPAFDASPYFFNTVHLGSIPMMLRNRHFGGSLRAVLFVLGFLLAAALLVAVTILLPARRLAKIQAGSTRPPMGGIVYFIFIGVGFMLVEMAMIQQLAILLGHPIYSLVVVLGGLVLSSGAGSLISDKLSVRSTLQSRAPALAVTLAVIAYSIAVVPAMHAFTGGMLWQRIAVSLVLIVPCGLKPHGTMSSKDTAMRCQSIPACESVHRRNNGDGGRNHRQSDGDNTGARLLQCRADG